MGPAVPESICRPSCVWGSVTGSNPKPKPNPKPNPKPKRFSLDWNASGVSDCRVRNNTCELGKIVFCDGEGPVSIVKNGVNGLGCMADDCKERYCYDLSLTLLTHFTHFTHSLTHSFTSLITQHTTYSHTHFISLTHSLTHSLGIATICLSVWVRQLSHQIILVPVRNDIIDSFRLHLN